MTINKSLISIAAATLLVAGFTGCGSSSSSTAATTTTTPTTLTVTDGYVVNFTATATISDGNSSTSSNAAANITTVPLPNANVKASIVAGGTQTAGVSTLDLTQDLTTAQIANLVSVNITRAAQTTNGTTLTYASFFDTDSDGTFVAANGDIVAPATLAMSAPAGYANVTPITTLINARITALTAADTNDTNRTAITALALTQMAAALGLSETDIQNVDPIGAVTANPTYTLVNSMLGQVITDNQMAALATSLATATAATDAASALTNIANAGGLSAAYFTSAADQITADSSFLAGVSSMNLDATRLSTAGQTTFTPVTLTAGTADYNVTAIEIAGTDAAALLAAGAKVDFADLDLTSLSVTADGNKSNTRMTLAVSISSQEEYILDDANISSLSFLVPFDVNSTLGVEAASVAGSVTWEGVNPSGALFSGELNATAFTTLATAAGVAPFVTADGNITFGIGSMITAIDTNSSNAAAILDSKISSVSIALVDDNNVSTMQRVSGTNGVYWANASVTAIGGTINVTGKGIYKNILTDGRNGTVGINTAPAMTTFDVNGTATQADGATQLYDYNSALVAFPQVLNIDSGFQTGESNNSVTISATPSWITNTTGATAVTNGGTGASADYTLTVDTNVSLPDTNSTVTVTVTDEFGAVSTGDHNLSFFFNAYPVVTTTSALVTNFTKVSDILYTADVNTTAVANTDIVFNLTNLMGEQNATVTEDVNATVNQPAVVLNAVTGVGTITLRDLNQSTQDADIAITINGTLGALTNVVVDLNVSN